MVDSVFISSRTAAASPKDPNARDEAGAARGFDGGERRAGCLAAWLADAAAGNPTSATWNSGEKTPNYLHITPYIRSQLLIAIRVFTYAPLVWIANIFI